MSVPDTRWWIIGFVTVIIAPVIIESLFPNLPWWQSLALMIPIFLFFTWCLGRRTWDSRIIGLSFEERIENLRDKDS